MTGTSPPAFWLGLGVYRAVLRSSGILPGGGRLNDWLDPPAHVTGFYLIDAAGRQHRRLFSMRFQHLILPSLALAFYFLGSLPPDSFRHAGTTEGEDYIRTARPARQPAKIFCPSLTCAALPNALIPSITVLGGAGRSALRCGIDQTVFARPGHGRLGGDLNSGTRLPGGNGDLPWWSRSPMCWSTGGGFALFVGRSSGGRGEVLNDAHTRNADRPRDSTPPARTGPNCSG